MLVVATQLIRSERDGSDVANPEELNKIMRQLVDFCENSDQPVAFIGCRKSTTVYIAISNDAAESFILSVFLFSS